MGIVILFSVVESVTYRENGYRSVSFECPRCRTIDETLWPHQATKILDHWCNKQGCGAHYNVKIPDWVLNSRSNDFSAKPKLVVDGPRALVDASVLAALRGDTSNELNDNAISDRIGKSLVNGRMDKRMANDRSGEGSAVDDPTSNCDE